MKVKELKNLLKMLDKLKREPDWEEFDNMMIIEDLIDILNVYIDFLGDDEDEK